MNSYTLQIIDLTPDQIRAVAEVMERKGVPLEEYERLGIRPVIEAGGKDEQGLRPDRLLGFEPYTA